MSGKYHFYKAPSFRGLAGTENPIKTFRNFLHFSMGGSKGFAVFFLIAFFVNVVEAQQSVLKLADIMEGESYTGYWPESPVWAADGSVLYFQWNPDFEPERSMYGYHLSGDSIYKVLPAEEIQVPQGAIIYNQNRSLGIFQARGDVWLYDYNDNSKVQITNTSQFYRAYGFAKGDSLVVMSASNQLYGWNRVTGQLTQFTDIKTGKDPDKEDEKPDFKRWVADDQERLFLVTRDQKAREERQKARNKALNAHKPKTIYTGTNTISRVDITPDTRFVIYSLAERSEPDRTAVPDFMHASGQVKDIPSRPKVGWVDQGFSLHVYDRLRDTVLDIDPETIPGIFDKPEFLEEYHTGDEPWNNQFEKPRKVAFSKISISPTGRVVVEIRSQDNKDRWLMHLDAESGTFQLLDRQRDEAWINGPGISGWNMASGEMGWTDRDHFWFQSEATGYSHLYLYNFLTEQTTALTSGNFEVHDVQWFAPENIFYLRTNEGSPFDQHIYRLDAGTGERTKLSATAGRHEFTLCPLGRHFGIRHSTATTPWELYIAKSDGVAQKNAITNSKSEPYLKYNWRTPEIIHFRAADGTMVTARLYKPERPRRNGPAVIFVHGAGYLQNVHNWWSSYYREYMFHNMLVDMGYTVLDVDYRGSAGYGRDWRTAIYRHMGGLDLTDHVDGAKYLVNEHRIDPAKIGIYGGSYGGFISIMAMMQHSDVFACGAGLRSVTDWAHYNHPYTANILNTPVTDSLAYMRSSPIYFAEGLGGPLLMLHGMVDVNVQYQDVVRLAQKFIELGKEDWELAVYPVEDHGFTRGDSWTDEYRRILELFERYLK